MNNYLHILAGPIIVRGVSHKNYREIGQMKTVANMRPENQHGTISDCSGGDEPFSYVIEFVFGAFDP